MTAAMTARILRTRVAYEGWVQLIVATLRLADGTEISREIEDHGAAVAVLPYDPERRVALLVRQLRAPMLQAGGADTCLEAPAGLLDEPDPAEAARREAYEEVGLRLRTLEPLGATWTMPGISTERMHLFLAPFAAADRIGAGGGLAEEHERIAVVELPLVELARMADAGELDDLKTLALVQTLRLRHLELFAEAA